MSDLESEVKGFSSEVANIGMYFEFTNVAETHCFQYVWVRSNRSAHFESPPTSTTARRDALCYVFKRSLGAATPRPHWLGCSIKEMHVREKLSDLLPSYPESFHGESYAHRKTEYANALMTACFSVAYGGSFAKCLAEEAGGNLRRVGCFPTLFEVTVQEIESIVKQSSYNLRLPKTIYARILKTRESSKSTYPDAFFKKGE